MEKHVTITAVTETSFKITLGLNDFFFSIFLLQKFTQNKFYADNNIHTKTTDYMHHTHLKIVFQLIVYIVTY